MSPIFSQVHYLSPQPKKKKKTKSQQKETHNTSFFLFSSEFVPRPALPKYKMFKSIII